MKKVIGIIIIVALLLVTVACGNEVDSSFGNSAPSQASESAPAVPSESAEPAPAPQAGGNPVNYEVVAAELDRVMEENGADEMARFSRFPDNFCLADYDNMTVYRTTGLMGYNIIVLYLKESGTYQVLDMGKYSLFTIRGIVPLNENPDIIKIFTESRVLGGDRTFVNFLSQIYYSVSQSRVTAARYDPIASGIYGTVGTRDWQRFDECAVDGNQAVFTFKLAPGGNGNGYNGPEIITRVAPRYDSESPSVIGFRNTELNLSSDFIAGVQAMEGVASAEFEYIKTGIFTGTQLTITPGPDYIVTCSMNSDGEVRELHDFTIRCVRIRYDEPDLTDALGFKVVLPQECPPVIGTELYGDYTANVTFQLDKTNIAHLRIAEDVGESIDVYRSKWGEFDTEKEMAINGVTVKIGWNMSGPMTAVWNRNGYAMNFFMNEGETELSYESFQGRVEWCVNDVSLEPYISSLMESASKSQESSEDLSFYDFVPGPGDDAYYLEVVGAKDAILEVVQERVEAYRNGTPPDNSNHHPPYPADFPPVSELHQIQSEKDFAIRFAGNPDALGSVYIAVPIGDDGEYELHMTVSLIDTDGQVQWESGNTFFKRVSAIKWHQQDVDLYH